MIIEASSASDAQTPLPQEGGFPSRKDRPWRLLAGLSVITLSIIGFSLLFAMNTIPIDDPTSDLSSSSDYLSPGSQSAADGPVRIKYQVADGFVSLPNEGTIALTDDLELAVSTSPYPPTSFDVAVDLYLATADGVPVDDATITAVWDMVFMWHGPFETEFSNLGAGHYGAPFDFFMFGPWELVTRVEAPSHGQPDDLSLSIYIWPE